MMSDNAKMKNKNANRLTTKHVILILGVLVIVCAAIVAVIVLTRLATDIGETPTPGGNLIINESNIEDIGREIEEKVAKGMFETHMNTTWTFPDGQSASTDAIMGNAASNNYPFWFAVTLSDTGEVVYTSSLLPVGSQLQEIKLDADLDKGEYPAVLTIHMIDEDGSEVESNMGFNIILAIRN
jgi:hypothetical protein